MNRFLTGLCGPTFLLLAGCQSLLPAETVGGAMECPTQTLECPTCTPLVCPEPKVVEKVVTKYVPRPSSAQHEDFIDIVGAVEWAFVEPGDLVLEARVDSGAETSSIHAENIQLLEKDGKRYVSFTLENPETREMVSLERRLHRKVLIKQTGELDSERRYVVRMWVTMGKKRTWLDMSLSDRDDFEFPLLLGRNMLVDEFIVDVSKHHTQSRQSLTQPRKPRTKPKKPRAQPKKSPEAK